MSTDDSHSKGGRSYPKCFGPYLRYAISTGFANFELFRGEFALFFLVEFRDAGLTEEFATQIRYPVKFGPTAEDTANTRYATMFASASAVTNPDAIPTWKETWEKNVSRIELSLPLKSELKPPFARLRPTTRRWTEGKHRAGKLLIGMMDDGCPFAAAQFLTRRSAIDPLTTRVRGIWDQDEHKQPVSVAVGVNTSRTFGHTPLDFEYGVEFSRDFNSPDPLNPEIGLDEWIDRHLMPTGSIDEDGCYADAKFENLASQQSHGAHVMDVLAGRVPTSSRIGPSRPGPGHDRRDPPSWLPADPATDPTCDIVDTDLVFVQFAEKSIRDATGVWLLAYVEQGIQYILSFAEPHWTEKVIINLSYGPTTGPHDGTALLEERLTALVKHFNGTHGRPKLEIVLAAGNAYLTEGHVAFTNHTSRPATVEWTWRLPPDNSVLCFAEIWMNTAYAGPVIVTLISPSGITVASTAGPVAPPPGTTLPPFTGVYAPVSSGGETMWLLSVNATIIAPGVVPEHGDWTIRVDKVPAHAELHAYVARTDPNLGVQSGAKLSSFVDPKWERTHAAAASCKRVNGEFDKTGSLIHRHGTLNGIATAKNSRVHVAGGYVVIDGRKSPYASAGPARTGPLAHRDGPDFALPCDESFALEGIRAGGTRSGSVFRLIGTSVAAPQLARELARGPLPPATRVPTAPGEIEKRGGGDLEPP